MPETETPSAPTPETTTQTPSQAPATETTTTTEPPKSEVPGGPSLLNQEEPAKEESKPAGAPEVYTEFTAPEGITLDKAAVEANHPLFKELGLSQEQAQKIVEAQAKREADIIQRGNQAYNETRANWVKEVKATYGNTLATEVRPAIGKLLESLPEDVRGQFRQAMDYTGAGDHPGFVNAFYHIAKAAAEGKFVKPGSPVTQSPNRPATRAEAIYGSRPNGAAQSA